MKLADHPNVRVLFRRGRAMISAQVVLGLLGLFALYFAQYMFRNAERANASAFAWGGLALGIMCLVGLWHIRKWAYLVTDDAIAERAGPRLHEFPAIRWDDVVGITWKFPLKWAWPSGCVIWATRGGHRDGSHMRGIRWQIGPQIKAVRDELESEHGPLGAILVNATLLSVKDTNALMAVLEQRGFAPLPTHVEPCRDLVSYPRRRP